MKVPIERSFRFLHEGESERANEVIDQRVKRLSKVAPDAISCRVAVTRPQEHQRSGSPYRARVRLTIPPGHELVASKDPHNSDNTDVGGIVGEAFDALERQLRATREQRAKPPRRRRHPTGFVVKLFRESGYGFIRTDDGDEEIYFHENSVTDGAFEQISIGDQVRFFAQDGDKGPQASTVQIVDRPGRRRSPKGTVESYVPEPWKP